MSSSSDRAAMKRALDRFPQHTDLHRLLKHGIHNYLFLSGGPRPCFRLREYGEGGKAKQLKGVTDILRKHVFPNYRYRRRSDSESSGVRSAAEGRRRGKKVHSQIEVWINEGAAALERRWGKESRRDGKDRVLPMVRRFIQWTRQAKLTPVIAELIVCDRESGIGSAVDVTMMSSNGYLVLIEIKTGLPNFLEHSTVLDTGPLASEKVRSMGASVTDSPRDQAFAQLLLYRAMIERQFGVQVGYRDATSGQLHTCCYVVHLAHQKEATAYSLPEHMVLAQDDLWEDLVRRMQEEKDLKTRAARLKKERKAREVARKGRRRRKSGAADRARARALASRQIFAASP